MIDAIDEVLAHAKEPMLFIPGHGPLATLQDLTSYRGMLATARARIAALVGDARTRQEIIEAKPTADLDPVWTSEGAWPDPDFWVELVYDGMVRAGTGVSPTGLAV